MTDSKPCSTLISSHAQLSNQDGTLWSFRISSSIGIFTVSHLNSSGSCLCGKSSFLIHVSSYAHSSFSIHVSSYSHSYVKGIIEHGITFRCSSIPHTHHGYSDVNWARCPDTRRSIFGFLIFHRPNLVSWSSTKQPAVSRSSAENEYRALAYAYTESICLSYVLRDLRHPVWSPIFLFCDNLSTTYMAANPVFHNQTKHIELDYHFVCERVKIGTHKVHFIPSVDQPMDVLTKGLSSPRFAFLRSKLVTSSPPSFRGVLV